MGIGSELMEELFAFPFVTRATEDGGKIFSPGMTQRDYMATEMAGAIVGALMGLPAWHGWSNPQIAAEAYNLADCMLAERSKP